MGTDYFQTPAFQEMEKTREDQIKAMIPGFETTFNGSTPR